MPASDGSTERRPMLDADHARGLMLEIAHLHGGWGPTMIVEDFSLTLPEGDTVAIIGRNGVGKSTLLELLVGRAQRRSGSIQVKGLDVSALPIHERARHGVAYVPQGREV